jgi:Cft2 family RNA processing exonuclease
VLLKILGGGDEIGAQCFFLKPDNKTNVVIDCGIRLKNNSLPDLNWLDDKKVDFLFITHGHLDHAGAAPVFASRHPETKIRMTYETAIIAKILLADTLKVARKQDRPSLYSKSQFDDFMNRVEVAEFGEWSKISESTEVCCWPAGHIRGASSILVKRRLGYNREKRLMVTGDLSFTDTPTVQGAKPLPKEFSWTNTLITEATNGMLALPDRRSEEQRLIDRVKQVQARNGHVLIPVFAVGRAQDVALTLAQAGIKLWMGGLAQKVLKSQAYDWDWFHPNIKLFERLTGDPVNLLADSRQPQVIVTTSGMMEAGKSKLFAHRWAGDRKNAIFIPGWQAEETLGRAMLNVRSGDWIEFPGLTPDRQQVHAEVEAFHLSAHADGPQLAEWIYSVLPYHVIVAHSEERGYKGLFRELKARGFRNNVRRAKNGKQFTFRY